MMFRREGRKKSTMGRTLVVHHDYGLTTWFGGKKLRTVRHQSATVFTKLEDTNEPPASPFLRQQQTGTFAPAAPETPTNASTCLMPEPGTAVATVSAAPAVAAPVTSPRTPTAAPATRPEDDPNYNPNPVSLDLNINRRTIAQFKRRPPKTKLASGIIQGLAHPRQTSSTHGVQGSPRFRRDPPLPWPFPTVSCPRPRADMTSGAEGTGLGCGGKHGAKVANPKAPSVVLGGGGDNMPYLYSDHHVALVILQKIYRGWGTQTHKGRGGIRHHRWNFDWPACCAPLLPHGTGRSGGHRVRPCHGRCSHDSSWPPPSRAGMPGCLRARMTPQQLRVSCCGWGMLLVRTGWYGPGASSFSPSPHGTCVWESCAHSMSRPPLEVPLAFLLQGSLPSVRTCGHETLKVLGATRCH